MYGGYYGGWGYYDDDDWMIGLAVGTAVVATAVAVDEEDDHHEHTTTTTTTTTTGAQATLPCTPTVTDVDGMTYYACGQQHYMLAYGGSGPIYIPVPTPQPASPPATGQ